MAEQKELKKAIFLVAGLATRFLPLSRVINKEFLPLADKPIIHYLVEEAANSGIKKIIFVIPPDRKGVSDYFKKSTKLENILKEKKKDGILEELDKIQELAKKISFAFAIQKEPLGDGHAILMAKKMINSEPVAVFFSDDIIDSKIPCLSQLNQVFKTSQVPIVALKKLPPERLSSYGVAKVEKIASRLYKIKDIIEKPSAGSAPSDLAVVGRYIITPELFNYLPKVLPEKGGEIYFSQALAKMVRDGKIIYGYEIEGDWLECGDKFLWLKSNIHFTLKHPQFGAKLKEYLKEEF